jgi:adenylate kinase family enzyme
MAYDFKTLNDKEFEQLIADLLARQFSTRVERFRPGKDKGVDGRFFITARREAVIQCKHWPRSKVSALTKYMGEVEKPKIDRLEPARYVLATSLELSRENKEAILTAVAPWISTPSDIFGNEDLNDLLAKFPDVERRHYKLWLSSVGVLKNVLHAAILGRSHFTLEELRNDATRYVQTGNHAAAKAKLEKLHTVLITGEPGIGKTTLAGQLCLEYVVEHGFQLCVIADSIEEAEAIFEAGTKQIYYFDDFLGRNYLEALDRHEDSHIVGFIRRVVQDGSKRFVLTSRTTILNQGKNLSDLFRIHNVERSEYEIRVDSLTELDRARILYNHIWFSQLGHSYVEQILSGKRYRTVIAHKNFNPRLISFITDAQKLTDISAGQYWAYIERTLTNPADVWGHVYHNQLSDYGRVLLLLTVYNGGTIGEPELRHAYELFLQLPLARRYSGISDFTTVASTLVGAVLNRTLDKDASVKYTLFNPSVADYVLRRTVGDTDLLSSVFQTLNTEGSLLNLRSLVVNEVISKADGKVVLSRLAKSKLPVALRESDVDYGALLAEMTLKHGGKDRGTKEIVTQFVNTVDLTEQSLSQWESLASATDMCLREGRTTPERALSLVRKSSSSSLNHDDLLALSVMRGHLEGEIGREVEVILRPLIVSYWEDTIESDIRENGLLAQLFSEDDIPEGEDIVRRTVEEILSEYGLAFEASDVQTIANRVDVAYEIESNQQRAAGEDYESEREVYGWGGPDAVDDLFQTDGPMGGRGAR